MRERLDGAELLHDGLSVNYLAYVVFIGLRRAARYVQESDLLLSRYIFRQYECALAVTVS